MDHDLSNQFFSTCNRRGLIPGPKEDLEMFLQRISHYRESVPVDEEVAKLLAPFDLYVNWVPIDFSDQGLLPWQAAVTFIDPPFVRIQLKAHFAFHKTLWKRYDRSQVLAHELLHAARMAFEESIFEELLVSLLEKRRWQQIFRSLVSKEWESWLLLAGLAVALFSTVLLFVFPSAFLILLGFLAFPYGYLFFLCLRQIYRLWRLGRALAIIKMLVKDSNHQLAFLFRLTDWEILHFGRWSKEKIQAYIEQNETLRWQFLKSYL